MYRSSSIHPAKHLLALYPMIDRDSCCMACHHMCTSQSMKKCHQYVRSRGTNRAESGNLTMQARARRGQPTSINAADGASAVLNHRLRKALLDPCQALLSVCLVPLSPFLHSYHRSSLSPHSQLLSGPGCPLVENGPPQPASTKPLHLCLPVALTLSHCTTWAVATSMPTMATRVKLWGKRSGEQSGMGIQTLTSWR